MLVLGQPVGAVSDEEGGGPGDLTKSRDLERCPFR